MKDQARYLIVNADDFGYSPGVNRGIIEAHEHGIVTSTSLMVHRPAARDAVDLAREHPRLGMGLHIDLAEWIYADGEWVPLYEVIPMDDPGAVRGEIERQLTCFRDLTGRDPTHLDSHQHVHRDEPVRSVVLETARALGVPARSLSPDIAYNGEFYGQLGTGEPYPEGIAIDHLLSILERLPPSIVELACHPGYVSDMTSVYRQEREHELRVLCNPHVRAAIEEMSIQLCSFTDLDIPSNP